MFVFFILSVISMAIISFGVSSYFSKNKPKKFWSNYKAPKVNDIVGYNKSLGKLLVFYGVFLEIIGLPILMDQNSPLVIITILGIVFLNIIMMSIYVLVIEPKYCVKEKL